MQVAIVCPYDLGAAGGVQQLCRELASYLRAAGDEVDLIGPGTAPDAVGASRRVRANRSSVPLSMDPRSVRSVRRRLERTDVIHVHEPFVPLVGWAALLAGGPRVATFHADPAPWTRRLYRVAAPLGARLLEGTILTIPSPVAAGALPSGWGDPQLIPNAIDVSSYQVEVPRRPHRVVFLGRDDPRKGLEILLRAWPRVRAEVPDAELVVMGSERPESPPGVDFRGRVEEEDKRRILASAAVMVAPNRGGESFGIVLAEAMAAGCAVVATDLDAFAEVLGGTGILFPVGDSDRLAAEVVGLLRDPHRASELAREARAAAARFDWPQVGERYRAAYESAVARYRTTIHRWKE